MTMVCAICYDRLRLTSKDVSATTCGHVFHHLCLMQWLNRAQSCPECRQPVAGDEVIRIYLNFVTYESVRSKTASITSELKLGKKELRVFRWTEFAFLENDELRKRIKEAEATMSENSILIEALRQENSQLASLQHQLEIKESDRNLFRNLSIKLTRENYLLTERIKNARVSHCRTGKSSLCQTIRVFFYLLLTSTVGIFTVNFIFNQLYPSRPRPL